MQRTNQQRSRKSNVLCIYDGVVFPMVDQTNQITGTVTILICHYFIFVALHHKSDGALVAVAN